MAYRLLKNEQLSFGLKRIVLEEIDGALFDLSDSTKNIDEEIHSARRHFKKIRAVLRLARLAIGEETFNSANLNIRDAARNLASSRNSAVMLRTLDKLHFQDDASNVTMSVIKKHLEVKYEKTKLRKGESAKIVRDTKRLLNEMRSNVHLWEIEGDDFNLVYRGINDVYSKGRKYLADTQLLTTDFILHEWRKHSKYLWYTLKLFSNLWANYFNALAAELENLSEKLGEINDLSLFEKNLSELREDISSQTAEDLIRQINERKNKLTGKAILIGEKLFIDKPKIFTSRVNHLFTFWKSNQ